MDLCDFLALNIPSPHIFSHSCNNPMLCRLCDDPRAPPIRSLYKPEETEFALALPPLRWYFRFLNVCKNERIHGVVTFHHIHCEVSWPYGDKQDTSVICTAHFAYFFAQKSSRLVYQAHQGGETPRSSHGRRRHHPDGITVVISCISLVQRQAHRHKEVPDYRIEKPAGFLFRNTWKLLRHCSCRSNRASAHIVVTLCHTAIGG